MCQIFIHHSLADDLITLTGPWAAAIKDDKLNVLCLKSSEILSTYRYKPDSINVFINDVSEGNANSYAPHYLGARDLQARILTTSSFKDKDKIIVYKYLDNIRSYYTPTTAFGYHEKLKALVLEDLNRKFMNTDFYWKPEIRDPIYGSQLLKKSIELYNKKEKCGSPNDKSIILTLINDLFHKCVQNGSESFSGSGYGDMNLFKDAKKVLGISYSTEEIFSEAHKYQDTEGLLINDQNKEIWRESGSFGLNPEKVRIKFGYSVDDRGWLYRVEELEMPNNLLGCLMVNKWKI